MPKDDLLAAKVRDGLLLSRKRPYFLGFLTEEEGAACEDLLAREGEALSLFWGGYPEAERKLLGLFPAYLEPDPEDFPLAAVTFLYRGEDALSHRDFLGSLMALGLERDVVGDILVGKGRCVTFLRQEMAPYVTANLRKIGRVGVRTVLGVEGELPLDREFRVITGVVASQRLDCLVGLVCRVSREKAAGLIAAGLVSRNHREALSGSDRVSEGDVLSIRKYGKFTVDRLGPLTSKGRLSVQCRKYI